MFNQFINLRKGIIFISFLLLVITNVFAQLQFIENKGQWQKQIKYRADIPSGNIFLEKNGITVRLDNSQDLKNYSEHIHGGNFTITENSQKNERLEKAVAGQTENTLTVHSHVYKMNFIGASENSEIIPDKTLSTYNNYFIGNDSSKWKAGCKIFQSVTYRNIYPNIDVHYYTDAGNLKYDLIIHPGGNINNIALQFEGTNGLGIENKELIIKTSVGNVKELYPYTYQYTNAERQTLNCRYVLKNNIVKFRLENYSPGATVVIDPTLVFSSFTGSSADNWGYTATPGPDGSFYAGGIIRDNGYPVSVGAFQTNYNGGSNEVDAGGNVTSFPHDIAIMKLSADGSQRMYATYLGGNGNEQPHSMICDPQGNLVVAGRSNSSDYPNLTPGFSSGGYDIVITKFNADGTGLIGSVKIGGTGDDGVNVRQKYLSGNPSTITAGVWETRRNYGDDARSEVILDAQQNIVLASCTQSANFPVRGNVFQKTFGGGKQDGVIMKFNSNLSNCIFSSFFGGAATDACFVLSINPLDKNIYVAGATTSTNLPGSTTGVIYPAYQGGATDGFITKITPDGTSLINTTYIGTSGNDMVYGIQFDKYGFPYIMGTTTGTWPVMNVVFKSTGGRQFISKLKPDLSAFVYSTVFGTNAPDYPNISPIAFLVDRCQNVYVSGWGGTIATSSVMSYPSAGTNGLPITNDAIQKSTDGYDFYFFVLERNGNSQLFGSFFGQNGGFGDHVDGGTSRFDAYGVIYQAICANCEGGATFPTTPKAWRRTNGSPDCNEAMVKIEMNFTGVAASIKPTINGSYDTVGCVPMNISFTDTVARGKKYIWNFGDGSPQSITTVPTAAHIYNNVGKYLVQLVSIDSSTCNIADTAYVTIKVGDNIVTPDFTATKTGGCDSYTYRFDNTTTAVKPVYTDTSFVWDFGDGTPLVKSGFVSVTHTFASYGTYNVKLKVIDTFFCNQPDSVIKPLRISNNVKAQFTTPASGCVPYTASFTNTSLGGTDFVWDFGDGTTSKDVSPSHTFSFVGKYTVRLISIDLNTCNQRDTFTYLIEVLPLPIADFSFSPVPPEKNVPVQFINQSKNADKYIWDFGDNSASTLANPSHQYNRTDTFTVCLQAISPVGCIDTTCKAVPAIVSALLDVPNAFTPGRNDINSIIKVEGFGINKMSWKIYNRWGQLVFESTDKNIGWDGSFHGKRQPMDVYTYTLDAELIDGGKISRTGDITLIR